LVHCEWAAFAVNKKRNNMSKDLRKARVIRQELRLSVFGNIALNF
jgi:hypothetical protein